MGYPVTHTLSPAMHNAACEVLGLDYVYIAFEVKPEAIKNAVEGIRALNLAGVNVTIPHKETVLPYLDEVDKEALLIGAVNTIVNRNGQLCGYNTDGRGFIESLKEAGVRPERQRVLLTGAGGAARAIAFSLALHKASAVAIYDIDQHKARTLIQAVSKAEPLCQVVEGRPENVQDYNIVINATPLGLKDSDPLPVDPSLLGQDHVVYDAIYRKTKLLEQAQSRGAMAIDGSGMLLWQGALAFEIWTGKKPPVDVMRKALMSKRA